MNMSSYYRQIPFVGLGFFCIFFLAMVTFRQGWFLCMSSFGCLCLVVSAFVMNCLKNFFCKMICYKSSGMFRSGTMVSKVSILYIRPIVLSED